MSSLKRYPAWIGGEAVFEGASLTVRDKYSGEAAATVIVPGRDLVEAAIARCAAATRPMRELPPFARQEILERCVVALRDRSDELAQLLAIEAGKPIKDGKGEVVRLIDTFRIAAAEAVRIEGETVNLEISPRAKGYRGMTKRVPVGPCSFITPFNFPLNLVAHKVAPAIAAGCPFILKPSDRAPLGALIIAEVLAETGLPKGAFSVIVPSIADLSPLIEDDRLKLLSFTGSDKVGWDLKARARKKKVALELGGNAACVVDRDQEKSLDRVIDRLAFGAFYQSGQSCISVQTILVHADLYDAVRDGLAAKAKALVAGDPKDEATSLGPLIDEAAAKRVEAEVASAVRRGAKIVCGGKRSGAFFDATLLETVPRDEPLATDEAFAPVAILERFGTIDEAFERVNASRYGLQAGIFTNDLGTSMRAWDELEVGGVVINDVPSFRVDNMPYGGVKDSGLGREGVRSAIAEMTEPRLLVLRT